MLPTNSTPSLSPQAPRAEAGPTSLWAIGCYGAFLLASTYALDWGAKKHRDYRLRKFGSPPPLVPSIAPLGLDLALYSLFRFFRYTFFELVCRWLDTAPGHTVELRMFGNGIIFTDAPENIKDIMLTRWASFGRGEVTRRIWGDMLGDSQIFVVDGDLWHQSKERIKSHVGKLRADDLEITETHARQLFNRFSTNAPVEVYDLVDRYQLDVVTDVFFGESANSLTSAHPFREPMDTLNPINTARMLFGRLAYYVKDSYLAPRALRELHAYTTGVADRAFARDVSQKSPKDYNMLEDLVSQKKTVKDLQDSMMSIILGGKDPSAILISWAIFLMAKNPQVMKKMQAQVFSICGENLPTATDLKEMTYIRHVLNETFRLYHPLGLNVRMALEDATLATGGGKSGKEPLAVSKDTTIIYSLGAMQRRKDIWGDDAHLFRPERWDGADVDRWHFIPYNHGPRHCLGRFFGQQQMEYILARICQEYEEIQVPEGQPEQRIRIELNLKMARPCICKFVSRKKGV
ncbi:cytochrome P450 [Nemania serpens]|nr:cytochrome P450 [Nemania serpens]